MYVCIYILCTVCSIERVRQFFFMDLLSAFIQTLLSSRFKMYKMKDAWISTAVWQCSALFVGEHLNPVNQLLCISRAVPDILLSLSAQQLYLKITSAFSEGSSLFYKPVRRSMSWRPFSYHKINKPLNVAK